jgi:hypothetical protein
MRSQTSEVPHCSTRAVRSEHDLGTPDLGRDDRIEIAPDMLGADGGSSCLADDRNMARTRFRAGGPQASLVGEAYSEQMHLYPSYGSCPL